MSVVTVSMPGELLAKIDGIVEDHDYSGRSEVVRQAGRKLVAEFDRRELDDRELLGVVNVLYPYNSADVEAELHDRRHDYSELIASNTHTCVGDDQGCLETFVVECDLDALSAFVRDLEATGEAVEVDYSIYPVADIGEAVSFSA
jgi:CopG family nickel-responsive transcriptional regulator